MDVLLVNSPLFDSRGQAEEYADPPPLGLGYIATALRLRGYDVSLVDAVAQGMSVNALCQLLEKTKASYVGLNVFSTNLQLVEKIVTSPHSSRLIVGGPAAKSLVDHILQWDTPNPVTVITGDAEHALPALLETRASPSPWKGGTDRNVLCVDPSSQWFPNVIDLPLDRTFFLHEPIHETQWDIWESHLITSRGCGHDCAFCSAAHSVNPNQTIRFRSEAHIAQEIDEICSRDPRVNCIRILDDLFLRNPSYIDRAVRLFQMRHLRWRGMAHISGLARSPEDTFQRLQSSGCLELFVGIESGDPVRRKLIGKPSDLDGTWRVVTGLLKAGINVKGYFILGFPGETEAEMKATCEFACRIADHARHTPGLFRVSVFKFRPYHGTKLYNELASSGIVPATIGEDSGLADLYGRRPYGFTSDNYSAVPTDRLNGFISSMVALNP